MRLAQIGFYGHHSLLHLAGSDRLDKQIVNRLELVAVASEGEEGTPPPRVKSEFSGVPLFADYRRMIEAVKPDIVSIGCRYALNGKAALFALERGIRVVCEKPVADSLSELAALDDCVRRSGIPLIPEFTMRWLPAFQAARGVVKSGALGRVVLASAQKSYAFGNRPEFYRKRSLYGGTVGWVAVHAIDFIRWCTGLEYASVAGFHGNLSQPGYAECEDHAVLSFGLRGGGAASVTADFLNPCTPGFRNDDRLRIAGELGCVEVRHGSCYHRATGVEEKCLASGGALPEEVANGLLRCALGESTHVTWEDARRVTEVCLLARDAADSGIPREIAPS